MRKRLLSFSYNQKKRASTLLALSQSEFEAAEILIEKKLYKESVVHLYFSCFYVSQTFLVQKIKLNPSHKLLESELHKNYGRQRAFPHRYLKLHSRLHKMRIDFDYQNVHSPDPVRVQKELRLLQAYIKFSLRVIPRLEVIEILQGIFEENKKTIKDFSYDVYCPKTYMHHVRATIWQPPFYLTIFSHKKIAAIMQVAFKALRVRKHDEYVIGLNSKVDQYENNHLLMLDVDAIDPAIESALKPIGGILLKSGRGYHFIGDKILLGRKEWEQCLKKLMRTASLSKHLDKKHINISLKRGYSTLRVTSSKLKPIVPFFYKHI